MPAIDAIICDKSRGFRVAGRRSRSARYRHIAYRVGSRVGQSYVREPTLYIHTAVDIRRCCLSAYLSILKPARGSHNALSDKYKLKAYLLTLHLRSRRRRRSRLRCCIFIVKYDTARREPAEIVLHISGTNRCTRDGASGVDNNVTRSLVDTDPRIPRVSFR